MRLRLVRYAGQAALLVVLGGGLGPFWWKWFPRAGVRGAMGMERPGIGTNCPRSLFSAVNSGTVHEGHEGGRFPQSSIMAQRLLMRRLIEKL